MNASFRTAFWAMCLGLTVPMVLLVGVELTSGGRASRRSSLAAADSNASLRSQWEGAALKSARRDATRPTVKSRSPGRESAGRNARDIAADGAVVLDPQLEVDPLVPEPDTAHDRHVRALVTGNRPRVDIVPEEINGSGASAPDGREIEMRLANIQSRLDRLGRAIADQPPRDAPADPARQAAELLKQLQQARELDKVAAQFPKLTEPEHEDVIHESDPAGTGTKPAESGEKQGLVPEPRPAAPKKARLFTKIYRPRHLSAGALQSLVAPLLTPGIGKAGASDAGTDDAAPSAAGESSPAPVSAVVVRDYPEVLRKIDLLVRQLDIPPVPVMIEATVVTVRLSRGMPHGIDLQKFKPAGFTIAPADRLPATAPASAASQAPGATTSPGSRGSVLTHGLGLKCGVLEGDPRAFLSTLEETLPVRRTNAWQINVLNRQPAQVMVNDPYSAEGSSGMILRVRPIVAAGGLVTLDVRRDVDLDTAAARSRSAALTHQIVLQEGQTAVAAGFYAEHLSAPLASAPGTGPLRVTGPANGRQPGVIERCETIVILTPHVVRPGSEAGQTRRTDISPSIVRKRPTVQQAAEMSAKTPTRKVSPGRSIRTVQGTPADLAPKTPATDSEPRRLPVENAAAARSVGPESTAPEETADLDEIPVIEIAIPVDKGQGPMIRPAGAKTAR